MIRKQDVRTANVLTREILGFKLGKYLCARHCIGMWMQFIHNGVCLMYVSAILRMYSNNCTEYNLSWIKSHPNVIFINMTVSCPLAIMQIGQHAITHEVFHTPI